MARTPLKNGSIDCSINIRYNIKGKIGEGASGFVYDAEYVDGFGHKYKIRIKECFPQGLALSRDGSGNIICDEKDKEDFEEQKGRFNETYNQMVELSNEPSLLNLIVKPTGYFKEKNTAYYAVATDNGENFQKYAERITSLKDSLKDLFSLFKTISAAIIEFHNEGILLLDIKPQNILIMDTEPKTVKFFDFDSITRKKDIEKNSLEYIHFSEGFASPEQLTGDKKHISEKTDIYAFGAMLYHVLFGKNYDYIKEFTGDSIPYSTMRFPDHQPKLEEKLNKFFSKALAILPEDRFENMTEVRDQLDELIKLSGSLFDLKPVGFERSDILNPLYNEFKSISKEFETEEFDPEEIPGKYIAGRYILLIKFLAQYDAAKLISSEEVRDLGRSCFEYVAKNFVGIKGEITADDLCLGIWAEYNLFAFFDDNEAFKKCSELFKYCDSSHKSKYSLLIIPFVNYQIDNQKDKGKLLDLIKWILNYFDYPRSDTVECVLMEAIEKFQSDPRLYILLLLFNSMLRRGKVIYEGDGRDKYFKAAEYFFNKFMPNDDFAERSIRYVADIKGDGYETRIIPKRYDYDEDYGYDKAAEEELFREFKKQIGITPEDLQ